MSLNIKKSDISLSSSMIGPKGIEGPIGPTGVVGFSGSYGLSGATGPSYSYVGLGSSNIISGGSSNVAIGNVAIGLNAIAVGGGSLYQIPEFDFTDGYGDQYSDKSVIKLSKTRIEMKAKGGKDNHEVDDVEINIGGKRFNLFETLEKLEKLESRVSELENIIENNRENTIKVTI